MRFARAKIPGTTGEVDASPYWSPGGQSAETSSSIARRVVEERPEWAAERAARSGPCVFARSPPGACGVG